MKRLASIVLLAATLYGCEQATSVDPPDTNEPTFTAVQTILTQSCAVSGCHVGSSAPEGLDLSAGNAYANLVSVASAQVPSLQRVRASAPDSSYLVDKITGSARMKPGTSRMPVGRAALSSSQIDLVRRWIAAGAKND